MAQEDARGRGENERLRADAESRLGEAEETHRAELAKLNDEHGAGDGVGGGRRARPSWPASTARTAPRSTACSGASPRSRRVAASGWRREIGKIRKEHEKAIAAAREEQAVQLASERQAYEALTEQKERDHRNEILAMRRRQEEELAGAEERRQRDIAEQEARRVAELEAAETRRRGELQARDEEQHTRVTDIERRHLTEKTELTEKHRAEYDQALGRAARAEGELAARVQEIEQAYRRLSGLEADLDAARAELGNRDVRLAQRAIASPSWKPRSPTTRTRSCAPSSASAPTTRPPRRRGARWRSRSRCSTSGRTRRRRRRRARSPTSPELKT